MGVRIQYFQSVQKAEAGFTGIYIESCKTGFHLKRNIFKNSLAGSGAPSLDLVKWDPHSPPSKSRSSDSRFPAKRRSRVSFQVQPNDGCSNYPFWPSMIIESRATGCTMKRLGDKRTANPWPQLLGCWPLQIWSISTYQRHGCSMLMLPFYQRGFTYVARPLLESVLHSSP